MYVVVIAVVLPEAGVAVAAVVKQVGALGTTGRCSQGSRITVAVVGCGSDVLIAARD